MAERSPSHRSRGFNRWRRKALAYVRRGTFALRFEPRSRDELAAALGERGIAVRREAAD